jgi:hypothetical protein
MGCRELTLADLLADPMTLAVMAADHVDPAALTACLAGLALRIQLNRPAEPTRSDIGRAERSW